MLQEYTSVHDVDADSNPAGGQSESTGIYVRWQDGPLGRGEERKEPNGAFVETVIAIAKDRLEFYESSKFACPENQMAIDHLDSALKVLNDRTLARERRDVEGTHAV